MNCQDRNALCQDVSSVSAESSPIPLDEKEEVNMMSPIVRKGLTSVNGIMSKRTSLQVLNLAVARYECTYGRGCDGICCQEGRPLVYPEEIDLLQANMEQFWHLLRPEARSLIQRKGFLTQRRRLGERTLRNVAGWCAFFNQGCVLHKVGAEQGDPFKYKPAVCALFPIQMDEKDRWYVRQRGYKGEKWDLFCLDPGSTPVPAAESLHTELALAQRFDDEMKQSPTTSPKSS